MEVNMKIKLLRHATVILTIGNKRILVDPMLKGSGECDPVPTCKKGKGLRNPLVELPFDKSEIHEMLNTIDAILITHMHFDHFDDLDGKTLPKHIPIL